METNLPRIVLLGRPNVGKSTLFNRLCRKRLAIVHDTPGVTRDWKEGRAEILGRPVMMIDTAGLEKKTEEGSIESLMRESSLQAMETADLVLFMVDGRAGILPDDENFARLARKSGKKVIALVNKAEGKAGDDTLYDIHRLGLGEAYTISSEHGDGMVEAMEAILRSLPEEEDDPDETQHKDEAESETDQAEEGDADFTFIDRDNPDDTPEIPLKIAVVGRPNAGKSTLVNAMLGEDRVITSPMPGATRDSITLDWEYEGRKFRLVDTAGLRKRSKVVDVLEKHSTSESIRAIRLAQIVVLVIDGTLSMDKQDLTIADHVIKEGRALVIAVNKWDVVENKDKKIGEIRDRLLRSLGQLPDAPLVTLSAIKGKKLDVLMERVMQTYRIWNARVATGPLNRWLAAQESHHPAPLVQGWPNRLRYITQIKTRPPTFALWVSRPKALPDSYKRYLENGLRADFDIRGVPIRILLRTSKNPYKD